MTSQPKRIAKKMQVPEESDETTPETVTMTPEGLDISHQMQAAKQVWQTETKKIFKESEGEDSTKQVRKQTKSDPAQIPGKSPASIEHILSTIEAIEETLEEKRRLIVEIQDRQRDLAEEYNKLGQTLDDISTDLSQQFVEFMND